MIKPWLEIIPPGEVMLVGILPWGIGNMVAGIFGATSGGCPFIPRVCEGSVVRWPVEIPGAGGATGGWTMREGPGVGASGLIIPSCGFSTAIFPLTPEIPGLVVLELRSSQVRRRLSLLHSPLRPGTLAMPAHRESSPFGPLTFQFRPCERGSARGQ